MQGAYSISTRMGVFVIHIQQAAFGANAARCDIKLLETNIFH